MQPLSHILVVAKWNDVIEYDDVQSGIDLFYAIAHELLDHYYPQSSITALLHRSLKSYLGNVTNS